MNAGVSSYHINSVFAFYPLSIPFPFPPSLLPPLVDAPRSGAFGGSGLALSERSEFGQTPPKASTAATVFKVKRFEAFERV
jgi:hypothetical protein